MLTQAAIVAVPKVLDAEWSRVNRRSWKVPERFFHFSLAEFCDDEGTPLDYRFSHCTAFCRQELDQDPGTEEITRTWYVSFAWCDARDQFSRALGRKVARRKYFGTDYFAESVGEACEYDHVKSIMLDYIV